MSAAVESAARFAFAQEFGVQPQGTVFAPGRVNLIGEHVDYNDGLVLPMPIPQGTGIAWDAGEGDTVEVYAADLCERDRFGAETPERPGDPDWRSYIRGMVAGWPGRIGGLRLAISGNLSRGSGLSSSASLCIAAGRAIAAATAEPVDPVAISKIAQRTEHEFAGVACGIMDQVAIAAGSAGQALLLDCRALTYQSITIPADWHIAVVQSGVKRGLVGGEYNTRREQCEAAARGLGVMSLRDATLGNIDAADLGEVTKRRARHVVTEIERTCRAADALQAGNIAAFGQLLRESHISMRDDFEISVPAVDTLVEALNTAIGNRGGARMTGGGFGGAVVAVFERGLIETVRAAAGSRSFDIVY